MDKIPSFAIDHERLPRGLYVSRRDTTPAGDHITTFDVRLTLPNREPALSPTSLHAIEHLAATYLRNHPQWGPRIVYWGPMGCCTGCYLIVQGHLEPADITPLLIDTFTFIATYHGPIPGATPRDCGNYTFMDPDAARADAARYLNTLRSLSDANTRYPD